MAVLQKQNKKGSHPDCLHFSTTKDLLFSAIRIV
jgi:hypothetical protein